MTWKINKEHDTHASSIGTGATSISRVTSFASTIYDSRGRGSNLRVESMMIKRFYPHFLMFLVQTCYSVLYFIAEASFNKGLNPYIYITYRHFVGSLVMIPFAYMLERYIRKTS